MAESQVKRRWRDYRTASGSSPVREVLSEIPEDARAEVLAAMRDVREAGLIAARHVRGDIYEVRASHNRIDYRILFAVEGRRSQVLLSLEAFAKKTRKTPLNLIETAVRRLQDWRARGEADHADDAP